jgi:outer membrane beta-barrel protein
MVLIGRALAALALAATLSTSARADCVDPAEQKKLLESKRLTRASEERDFVKAGRHEISVMGGYYVSDLFDGTFVLTGAYTYHLTEDVGVEGSFGWSKVRSSVASKLEADHAVTVLPPEDRVFLVFANAVYAPLHGKAQLFSDYILHFDLYGSLGVGLIDNSTSLGAAGQAGVGIKAFLGKAFAIRLDVRDQVYRAQVLGTSQYVSDFQVTLGVSLFLPVSP